MSELFMELSPNDIRNYEFGTQMRGYVKDEVDGLLEQVATVLEGIKQENLRLSMEADSLKSQLSALRQFEDTIKSAAIDARRNADMTVANAKKEADLMVTEARAQADKAIGSRAQQVNEIEALISKAKLIKKAYLGKLRILIESHLELVEDLAKSGEGAKVEESIEVTESSEVDRREMTTLASEPSPPKGIQTEEGNAVEEVEPVVGETSPPVETTAATKDDDTPDAGFQEPKPIDPELAAALESYQQKVDEVPEQAEPASDSVESSFQMPSPATVVETTARAEDVPPGYIRRAAGISESTATEKVAVPESEPIAAASTPPTSVDKPAGEPLTSPDLAEELDKVVAKFEEEMDKAAKT